MIARIAIAAALAGSAIGTAAVLADDHPAPKVPAVTPAKTAPRDRQPPFQARGVTTAVTAADPDGGAGWAVLRFTAAEGDCAALVRVVKGRFGWIDGSGTFRPARAGRHEAPDFCYPAAELKKLGAVTYPTTTVTYAPGRSPQPSRGVVWGLAAPDIREIHPENDPRLTVTKGAFLAVSATPPVPSDKGALIRGDGSIRRYDYSPNFPKAFAVAKPDTRRVAVEAPDPAGGQPWGIISAQGPRGDVCRSQVGRLLGLRLGVIERPLDTFSPTFDEIICRPESSRRPTPAYPLRLSAGVWSRGFGDDASGHVERRVLLGRTTISGEVDPSVVSVTIRTPRDVRTLVPSRPDHLILAVYEGTFPTGDVTATAHLNTGRDVTRSVYVG